MNYLNAKEVLPPELFKEIQKYAKVEWAKNVDELREKLDSCNWNSDDSKDN